MTRGRKKGQVLGPYARHAAPPTMRAVQRIGAGLTQAGLALRAGVSERTVRSWEQGSKGGAGRGLSWSVERALDRALHDAVLEAEKRPTGPRIKPAAPGAPALTGSKPRKT